MSEMEKILQNWDAADEYLHSKIEEKAAAMNTDIQSKVETPQTAEVGQILAVKAVDDSGKPTEWETVDKGGGSSGEGRTVKMYDLVAGTQIAIGNGATYPCHIYTADASSTGVKFGEIAYVDKDSYGDYTLVVYFINVSNFATVKLNRSFYSFEGYYDEAKCIFTLSDTYRNFRLMI